MQKESLRQSALNTITIEINAVKKLLDRIDQNFIRACELILKCSGRIIVTGMGKSGHIGNKIAATLASTGTPSFFIHPAEASHGDLGMIAKQDVMIAISNSGNTKEVLTILPTIKRLGIPLITLTGKSNSKLALQADVNLDVGVAKEACPLNLAPTASTTTALVMGDALAIALLETKGFTEEDYAFSHPGGSLGRKLLLKIKDIMRTHKAIPKISENAKLVDALMEMSKKGLGMTAIVDDQNVIKGIFTDGDLRRALDHKPDIHTTLISSLMIRNCIVAHEDMLAAKALQLMEEKKIGQLLVANKKNQLVGAFNFHDLLQAGVI